MWVAKGLCWWGLSGSSNHTEWCLFQPKIAPFHFSALHTYEPFTAMPIAKGRYFLRRLVQWGQFNGRSYFAHLWSSTGWGLAVWSVDKSSQISYSECLSPFQSTHWHAFHLPKTERPAGFLHSFIGLFCLKIYVLKDPYLPWQFTDFCYCQNCWQICGNLQ